MRKAFFGAITLSIGITIGLFIQPLFSEDNIFNQIRKFDFILNAAYKNYVEDVDTYKLVESAIKGMLNELDPHSVYISAEEMKRVKEDFQGSFEGIGIEFDIFSDTIMVVTPIEGGPSSMLGILSGDKIVKIDDSNAVGISRNDVPKRLKGPKGTKVTVDIKRDGTTGLLHYVITRDRIPIKSVDAAFMLDGTDIGVVDVSRFANNTMDELIESLDILKAQGMKRLILDLRNNPGGLLNQAYLMADEFIPRGDTIVFTRSRRADQNEVYMSTAGGKYERIPLIILINPGSASASEIVSGAVQDLDRGLIVGETSFGKGLVQRQYDYSDGSAFRITISRYYTPSGRCIQRPYKDKEEYRSLVGRLELEEGLNVDHVIEKIKRESQDSIIPKKINEKGNGSKINMDSIPFYRTRAGRTVLGGGGITPDYIVKHDTITSLSVQFRNKNMFFEYVISFLKGEGRNIEPKYKNSFTDYFRNYTISEPILESFKKYAVDKGITWNDKEYETDKEFIKTAIKATIARVIWDNSKYLQIHYTQDRQILQALKLFPEAEKIAKLK